MLNALISSIVDSHNKVLSAWAAYRNTLDKPPRVITLDHHTDTSPPFRRLIAKVHGKDFSVTQFEKLQNSYLEAIHYSEPETVEEAVAKLSNDEHIVAAIKTNIISSAFVIAHNATKTDLETYEEHKIVCRSVDEVRSFKGLLRPDHDIVIESSFLEEAIIAFDQVLEQAGEGALLSSPYILDVDLDYFNSFKSVAPEDANVFKALAKNAGLITIATEPEYVQSCAVDPELTSEYLLEELKKLLSN